MLNKFLFLMFLVITSLIYGQVKDFQVGSSNLSNYQRQGGYYDYSQTNTLNIEVNIWGFVKYPGKYLIPSNSTVMDFMSYAGGPTDAANLYDIRIYRVMVDSTTGLADTTREFLSFNYEDLLWSDDLKNSGINIPGLKAGDNLSVPGEPKIYSKDWISIGLSIIGIFISLTTLIVTLAK